MLLTAANLDALTAQIEAHFAAYAPGADPMVWALRFGPEDCYARRTAYAGLTGCNLRRPGASVPAVRAQLADELAKVPAGGDLVVVFAKGWEDAWTACEGDEDGRRCLDRARDTKPDFFKPDYTTVTEMAAGLPGAVFLSEMGTPAECLECGGTERVEAGGMGCARCG